MVGTRSRSKRKEKAPQETPQQFEDSHQEFSPIRRFRIKFTASPSLRSPLRSIKKSVPSLSSTLKAEAAVLGEPIPTSTNIKSLELSTTVVNPDRVYEHPTNDVKPDLVEQSHMDRNDPKVATFRALYQEIQDIRASNPPSLLENCVLSPLEDTIPRKSTTIYAGKSSQCLSTSLNLTELVKRQLDEEDDDDEVDSALTPAFDSVNGHKVKRENAPLLRAIFDKYGDISEESKGLPPTIISCFLERVCAIYERLKGTKFSKVMHKDLTEMLDEVRFMQGQKINLGWLHKKLEYIHDTKMSSTKYLTAKEDGEKCVTNIRSLEEKLEVHKREVLLIEEKLVNEKDKADRHKKMARDIKTRVDDLRAHSLVDGLL